MNFQTLNICWCSFVVGLQFHNVWEGFISRCSPTPYRTVSDMLPPRRLNLVAFKELARFLRAMFLLFKESRLSHEAPAFWAEADLRTWIEQHQRYIETGKGQGIH